MNDTEEIILLTLILRSRRWKKEIIVQHVQSLNFGCEIFLPEENSMMNFIVWRKSWSLVIVNSFLCNLHVPHQAFLRLAKTAFLFYIFQKLICKFLFFLINVFFFSLFVYLFFFFSQTEYQAKKACARNILKEIGGLLWS